MRKKQPLSQLRCHLPYEGSLALSLPGMLQAVMPRTGPSFCDLRLSYLTEWICVKSNLSVSCADSSPMRGALP